MGTCSVARKGIVAFCSVVVASYRVFLSRPNKPASLKAKWEFRIVGRSISKIPETRSRNEGEPHHSSRTNLEYVYCRRWNAMM
jgi:hypothetical protein